MACVIRAESDSHIIIIILFFERQCTCNIIMVGTLGTAKSDRRPCAEFIIITYACIYTYFMAVVYCYTYGVKYVR